MREKSGRKPNNEAPVEKYRKDIGHHHEKSLSASSIRQRMKKNAKAKDQEVTLTTEPIPKSRKIIFFVLFWVVLIGVLYIVFLNLTKKREYPFMTS